MSNRGLDGVLRPLFSLEFPLQKLDNLSRDMSSLLRWQKAPRIPGRSMELVFEDGRLSFIEFLYFHRSAKNSDYFSPFGEFAELPPGGPPSDGALFTEVLARLKSYRTTKSRGLRFSCGRDRPSP